MIAVQVIAIHALQAQIVRYVNQGITSLTLHVARVRLELLITAHQRLVMLIAHQIARHVQHQQLVPHVKLITISYQMEPV